MKVDDLQKGATIGNYTIKAELGRGGMGVVFAARDLSLDRDVALKVLPQQLSDDPQLLRRFQREARAVAALSHPNIVTVFAVGKVGDVHFIAMELVQGRPLQEIIEEAGSLPCREAFLITLRIAQGLREAHNKGIVHRDLKPQNIMMSDEGRVKILDFGMAKVLHPHDTKLTMDGASLGTPLYMSPEQCVGTEVDARSDIYSLGVVLFEMLTGRPPHTHDTPLGVIRKIVDTPFPTLGVLDGRVPPPLRAVLAHMVHKKREDRYPTSKELCVALESALNQTQGGTATDPLGTDELNASSSSETMLSPSGVLPSQPRRRWLYPGLIVAAVVMAAAGLYIQFTGLPERPIVVSTEVQPVAVPAEVEVGNDAVRDSPGILEDDDSVREPESEAVDTLLEDLEAEVLESVQALLPAIDSNVAVKSDPAAPIQAISTFDTVEPGQRTFSVGKPVAFRVATALDCYVLLFNKDSDGNLSLLFPNPYEIDSLAKPDHEFRIPKLNGGYSFHARGPAGPSDWKLFAVSQGEDTAGKLAKLSDEMGNFSSGDSLEELFNSLEIVSLGSSEINVEIVE